MPASQIIKENNDGLEQYFKLTLSLNIKYDELHPQNHDFRLAIDIFVITSLKISPKDETLWK